MSNIQKSPLSANKPVAMIPVYQPDLSGNEKKYVNECLDTSWISSLGVFIDRFEKSFMDLTGVNHAASVSNGTVAIHLALHCLDIGAGDEVIVPTFTYISSVNTIAQTGAKPVFVDCLPGDWLLDPEDVKRKITSRTKAIMPVHLYGAICDMGAIMKIAREHNLYVIEDCAEALGSSLNGQHVGTFGDVGTFSFFGNKTVTTGEGGMVVSSDPKLAARLRLVKGQGQSLTRRYWHVELGFNYRMTNICAAIGLAQLERFDTIMHHKKRIGDLYRNLLKDTPVIFQQLGAGIKSSDWLVSLLLPESVNRDALMVAMKEHNVDTRPVFYCAHQMPMYEEPTIYKVSEDVAARGISLPSYPQLTNADIEYVVSVLKQSTGL